MENPSNSYHKLGFAILPGILTSTEVTSLREQILHRVSGRSFQFLHLDDALEIRDLALLPLKPRLLSALDTTLGSDWLSLNDINVHVGAYGSGKLRRNRADDGWHDDVASERETGADYLYSQGYSLLKIGVYLQDNIPGIGGGINVRPATHKDYFRLPTRLHETQGVRLSFGRAGYEVSRRLNPKRHRSHTVPTKAGDAILFDCRLAHQSTPYEGHDEGPAVDKIAIYWNVAGGVSEATHFLENSIRRRNRKLEPLFSSYLTRSYPNDYPEWYRAQANASKYKIASVNPEFAAAMRSFDEHQVAAFGNREHSK